MKNLLLTITLVTVSAYGYAQVNGGLQGPAAKNYKYWLDKDNKPQGTEVVTNDQKPLQGPAAKNHKTWKKAGQEVNHSTVATVTHRPRLLGPKAKNVKPWTFFEYAYANIPEDPKDSRVQNMHISD
jgi:hypothetical protein